MSDGHGAGYEAGGIMANKNLLREIGFGVVLNLRLMFNSSVENAVGKQFATGTDNESDPP